MDLRIGQEFEDDIAFTEDRQGTVGLVAGSLLQGWRCGERLFSEGQQRFDRGDIKELTTMVELQAGLQVQSLQVFGEFTLGTVVTTVQENENIDVAGGTVCTTGIGSTNECESEVVRKPFFGQGHG